MARYNLPQYQSVYRDPQSVAIHKELRDRYTNAFLADDELTAAVDGMSAADFEGDQELKNQLATEYNAKLAENARRGDYETMGTSIKRDARKFTQSYNPIKQNYDRVAAYQTELKKRLGEGNISEEQYSHAMGLSTQGYNGLQKREDGTIDDGSFFSGTRMVNYQDISAIIDERMEALEAQEGGSTIRRVGQGPNAMYERQVGNKWEIISQDRVDTVVADVISDPNVQAYLNQVGDMRSYNVADEDIKESLSVTLFGNPEDVEDAGLKGQLAELVASGKTDKKTIAMMEALQDQINYAEELLPGEGIADSEELILKRKQAFKSQRIQDEVMRKTGVARSTHMMNNVFTEDIQDWDSRYLVDYKNRLDNYVADFSVPLEAIQVDNPGGNTVKSINNYLGLQDQNKQSAVNGFNSTEAVKAYIESGVGGEDFTGFTEEDILNGNVPDELKGILEPTQLALKRSNLEKDIQEKLLSEARKANGYSDDTDAEAEELFLNNKFQSTHGFGTQSITGAEMVAAINKLYGREMEYEEALSTMNTLQKIANTYDPTELGSDNDGSNQRAKEAQEAVQRFSRILKEDYNMAGMFGSTLNKKELVIDDMLRFKNEYIQSRDKDLGDYLKKNAKRQVSGMGNTTAPGISEEHSQETTKIFTDYFTKVGVERSMNIGYGGSLHSGTGTIDSFREEISSSGGLGENLSKQEKESWATSEIKVAQVLFNESPGPDGGGITLIVKNSMGNTAQLYVPRHSFNNTQMSQYMNTPLYRAAEAKNRAKNKGVDDFSFQIKGGGEINFDFTTDGGDYVTFTMPVEDENGVTKMKTKSILSTSPEFAEELYELDVRGLLPF